MKTVRINRQKNFLRKFRRIFWFLNFRKQWNLALRGQRTQKQAKKKKKVIFLGIAVSATNWRNIVFKKVQTFERIKKHSKQNISNK